MIVLILDKNDIIEQHFLVKEDEIIVDVYFHLMLNGSTASNKPDNLYMYQQ